MGNRKHEPAHAPQLGITARLLGRAAGFSAARPRVCLALTLLITLLAGSAAWFKLEFHTSRLDLLSPKSAYNQRWLAYLDQFGYDDDAVVIVSHADPAKAAAALTAVGRELEQDSTVSSVLYRKSVGRVSDKALHLMPTAELAQLNQLLAASRDLLRFASSTATSAEWMRSRSSESPRSSGLLIAASESTSEMMQAAASQLTPSLTEASRGIDRLRDLVPDDDSLLLEDEGRLGLCLVRVSHPDQDSARAEAQLAAIQSHMSSVRARYPDVEFWLTGMPVLEWDESRSSQKDMQIATILSLLGVAVVFIIGFGSWRLPTAAVVCLAVGLVWTVGLTALLIGHLNLFSVAFGAIIAGLGIDYAIHLLARLQFTAKHHREMSLEQVLVESVEHCGTGILTGALTTAAAFAVAMLTPFRGITELGLICAVGTMCCMTATIIVLPAMIVWQSQVIPRLGRRASTPPESDLYDAWRDQLKPGAWHGMLDACQFGINHCVDRFRTFVIFGAIAVTIFACFYIHRLRYDHNLLNLQAEGVPSVHAERELLSRCSQSAWFAVSLAKSPEEARELRRRLSELPAVARVEEIGSVIAQSKSEEDHRRQISLCAAQAAELWHAVSALQSTSAAQQVSSPSRNSNVMQAAHVNGAVGAALLPQQITDPMQSLSASILKVSAVEPITLEDFPAPVRDRMAGHDGRTFLLRIFAKENLWQRENLADFVRQVESVDPRVTGHPIQTWYASGELEQSYIQSAIYALLVVLALLMIDLGSVRHVALAMLPVCLSMLQLFGLLTWLNIPLNAANMIVLPLILGIGIDDGVHVMHDFRAGRDRRFRLGLATTTAVILTSVTTMVGFGCMAIAEHRGLQSLGIVLLLGVGICLLNSWLTLPAVLSFGKIIPQQKETESDDFERGDQMSFDVREEDHSIVADQVWAPAAVLSGAVPILFAVPNYPEAQSTRL